MIDNKGRVWFTAGIPSPVNSAFCQKGSDHPSAKLFPVTRAGRQLAMYDPKSGKFTTIDTCFSTHHLQFDANDRLWASSGVGGTGVGDVVGWLRDTRMYDATGDEQKSQGWTALIFGIPREPASAPRTMSNPTSRSSRTRINASGRVSTALPKTPADGSIWGSVLGFPGAVARLDPGNNPPATALTEIYEIPPPGSSPRGIDVDSKGVAWVPLASGHIASFDRRKCKGPLNGPKASSARKVGRSIASRDPSSRAWQPPAARKRAT